MQTVLNQNKKRTAQRRARWKRRSVGHAPLTMSVHAWQKKTSQRAALPNIFGKFCAVYVGPGVLPVRCVSFVSSWRLNIRTICRIWRVQSKMRGPKILGRVTVGEGCLAGTFSKGRNSSVSHVSLRQTLTTTSSRALNT